jgi:acyl CoA:acetate/3-ketoacid CoA transferase beta subunit
VLTDIFETLGLHTGGAANRCMGTFGAGEIDRFGNVNSTRSADGSFIVGSGGANDIATAAQESIVVAQQRLQTFVDKVGYITSPGKRISAVVSTLGRFEKRGGDEFVLTGYFGLEGLSREDAVREIKDRCGWDLQVADDVQELPPATAEELALLRLFDPERFFLGKPVEAVQPVVPAK